MSNHFFPLYLHNYFQNIWQHHIHMFWKVPYCDIYFKVPTFLKNIKMSVAILWKADSMDKWIWENPPLTKKKSNRSFHHSPSKSLQYVNSENFQEEDYLIHHRTLFFNVTNESLHVFLLIYLNKSYFAICSFSLVSKHSHLPIFIKGKEVNTSSATINTGKKSKKPKLLFPL